MTDSQQIHEMLSAYLDGELTETEVRQVQSAVSDSPELAAELRQLRQVRMMLSDVPAARAPEGFADCVLELAERKHLLDLNHDHGSRHTSRWISIAAAAVIVLVVGAVVTVMMQLKFHTPAGSSVARTEDPSQVSSDAYSTRGRNAGGASDKKEGLSEPSAPSGLAHAAKAVADTDDEAAAVGLARLERVPPEAGTPVATIAGSSIEREDAVLAVAIGKPGPIQAADRVVIWVDSIDEAVSTLNVTLANNKLNTVRLVNNENVPVTRQSVLANGVKVGRAPVRADGDQPVEAQVVLWAPPERQRGVSAEVRKLSVDKYSWKVRSVSSTPDSITAVQNSQQGYVAKEHGDTLVARKRVHKLDSSRTIRDAAGKPVAISRTKRTITIDQKAVITKLIAREESAAKGAAAMARAADRPAVAEPAKKLNESAVARRMPSSESAATEDSDISTMDAGEKAKTRSTVRRDVDGIPRDRLTRPGEALSVNSKQESSAGFHKSAGLRPAVEFGLEMKKRDGQSWYEPRELFAIGQNEAASRGFVSKPLVIIIKVRPDSPARAQSLPATLRLPTQPTTQSARRQPTSQPVSEPAVDTDPAKEQ